jgi:hypothetical protein
VLIALVKQDVDYAKTRELTGDETVNSLAAAVVALHSYYKNPGRGTGEVEYDDTSNGRQVMGTDFGYTLIFVGPMDFKDLGRHVSLDEGGQYIFDITGHTVSIAVLQDIQAQSDALDLEPAACFLPDSDDRNYNGTELDEKVVHIWQKT